MLREYTEVDEEEKKKENDRSGILKHKILGSAAIGADRTVGRLGQVMDKILRSDCVNFRTVVDVIESGSLIEKNLFAFCLFLLLFT